LIAGTAIDTTDEIIEQNKIIEHNRGTAIGSETMQRLCRALWAALAILTLVNPIQAKEWKVVRMAAEGTYPPFNEKDAAGNWHGFDVDIGNALCDRLGAKCEWVAHEWATIIDDLLAGKYDAITASMTINRERKKSIDFTNKYYSALSALIAPRTTTIKSVSQRYLKGKRVATVKGTIFDSFLTQKMPYVDRRLYATQDEANLDLAFGAIDAVIGDKLFLGEWLQTKDGSCCIFVGGDIVDPLLGTAIGIGVRKEDSELKEMLNKALRAIIADGTYKKINDKYFPFSIY
jgi:polar amino acid transport system substrate-binding protein